MRIAYNVPANSVCRNLHLRREKLMIILNDQIKVANKLTHDPKMYSVEAKYAWDIVEELSQKLDKLTTRLEDCLCDENAYYMRDHRDVTLSQRDYEL